eukprot:NODE_181_length_15774_cov_0.163892.p7 type:complete len:276 gc:universal NODE_181_length_15774_cov_0.163892:116-943(+)
MTQENSVNHCCTFDIKGRCYQPVFACVTCDPSSTSYICHYCVQKCHVDHEIIDLYPKRDIICDCGTTSPDRTILCQYSTKLNPNNNKYTQNNKGLYCKCHSEYDGEQSMVSCYVCQEWYHSKCLDITDIPDGLYVCCPLFISKMLPHNSKIFKKFNNNYFLSSKMFCSCDDCRSICSVNNWNFIFEDDEVYETDEISSILDIDRADVGTIMLKLQSFASHLKRTAYEAALEENDAVVDKTHVIKAIKKMRLTQDSQMQEIYDEVIDELEQQEDDT